MNVLILDDDAEVRNVIKMVLDGLNFQAIEAVNIHQAKQQIDKADMAIVDVNLPDGDGYEFARDTRNQKPDISIIMLTIQNSTEDVVRGYIEGADIFLPKPFRTLELTAILYSLARRNKNNLPQRKILPWKLNVFGRSLVTPQGFTANLTERETVFLELLSKSERNLISKKEFVEAIGYNWLEFDDRRFDTFISRLRKRVREQTNIDIALRSDHHGSYFLLELIELINP